MDEEAPGQKTNGAKRTIEHLAKDYVVVGRTRVKPLYAWLVIGIMAGVAAGVMLTASRNRELVVSHADSSGSIASSTAAYFQ